MYGVKRRLFSAEAIDFSCIAPFCRMQSRTKGEDKVVCAVQSTPRDGHGIAAAQSFDVDSVGYWMRRFKSCDPHRGTYLCYDGYRHHAPEQATAPRQRIPC